MVMVLTYVVSGRGFGASGGLTRVAASLQHWVAPELTEQSVYFAPYFGGDAHPLHHYLVFMLAGILLGAVAGAALSGQLRFEVLRGPGISPGRRLVLAALGGVLVGSAARLARGCTSGQALVGGAELSVGSWAFMISIFAGGYAAAWFVRRQWL
jgi:uncharacterized membrane protein YedE/YeeE